MKYILIHDFFKTMKEFLKIYILYFVTLLLFSFYMKSLPNIGMDLAIQKILGIILVPEDIFSILLYTLNIVFFGLLALKVYTHSILQGSDCLFTRILKRKWVYYKLFSVFLILFLFKILAFVLVSCIFWYSSVFQFFFSNFCLTLFIVLFCLGIYILSCQFTLGFVLLGFLFVLLFQLEIKGIWVYLLLFISMVFYIYMNKKYLISVFERSK